MLWRLFQGVFNRFESCGSCFRVYSNCFTAQVLFMNAKSQYPNLSKAVTLLFILTVPSFFFIVYHIMALNSLFNIAF